MCRYGFTTYKPHYACFACRKSYKRRLLSDVVEVGVNTSSKAAKCPQCGELMANMGLDFKAPKTRDKKAWQHLSTLYEVGITFHSCGCGGPGYIPKDSKALVEHLQQLKASYEQQRHFWASRGEEPTTPEAIAKDERENGRYLWGIPAEARSSPDKVGYDASKAQLYWSAKVKEVEGRILLVLAAE